MKTNGKKLFIPILSAMFAGCLFGCSESGMIPNGCYCPEGAVTDGYFVLYEGDSDPRTSFCWEIKVTKRGNGRAAMSVLRRTLWKERTKFTLRAIRREILKSYTK